MELVGMSATTVVMSRAAASLLARTYGVQPGSVRIVPHGVPRLPLLDPDSVKPHLDLEGRLVILSFGLLGPGKGYESAIAAMPAVSRACPSALYVVLGATHPNLLAHEGEAYRGRLEATVEALDVTDHVRFVDKFVGRTELGNVARGGGHLRHALPEPRPDRVGHPVLRDGGRQGGGLDTVRLRPRADSPATAGGS